MRLWILLQVFFALELSQFLLFLVDLQLDFFIGKEDKQTAVQGFVIKMECRGRRYEYHSDIEGNEFVSCHELESCHETD